MKNLMKVVVVVIASFFIVSCSQNSNKQKELELKERELALKERELALKEKDTATIKVNIVDTVKNIKTSEIKKNSPNTKVMTMIFKDYSVGDNAYLIFNDKATGTEYQFMLSSDARSKFNGIKLILEDNDSEFGEKANPKYLNKSFIVEAVYKAVLMNGEEGKTVKEKMWVINDLKLAK